MRLVLAEPAERDLASIIDYIALDDLAAAEKVFRAIVATAERLADFPDMGHVGRLPDTRELTVTGLPYLIAYQADADTVTVLAVFHGARDLARALAERRSELLRLVRQSLGEPDPFRLRHREALRKIIGAIVRGRMGKKQATRHLGAWTSEHIDQTDRERFRETAERELLSLHEGNFARYQIRPSEFAAWRETWAR